AAGVTHRGRVDTRRLPEQPFGTPETAETENRGPQTLRERRLDPAILVYRMPFGHGQRFRPAGQCLLGCHLPGLVRTEPRHVSTVRAPTRSSVSDTVTTGRRWSHRR